MTNWWDNDLGFGRLTLVNFGIGVPLFLVCWEEAVVFDDSPAKFASFI